MNLNRKKPEPPRFPLLEVGMERDDSGVRPSGQRMMPRHSAVIRRARGIVDWLEAARPRHAQGREVGGSREKRAVGPCGQITTAEQVACTGVSRVRAGVEDGFARPQLSVIHG